MSATMKENLFTDYFNQCPSILVPGRTFPVKLHYLSEINAFLKVAQRNSNDVASDIMLASNYRSITEPSSVSSLGSSSGETGTSIAANSTLKIHHSSNSKTNEKEIGMKKLGGNATSKQTHRENVRQEKIKSIVANARAANNAAVEEGVNENNHDNSSKPPVFDSEIIAELIIRIIQVSRHNNAITASKNSSNNTTGGGEAILVFLSGLKAISEVQNALRRRKVTENNVKV